MVVTKVVRYFFCFKQVIQFRAVSYIYELFSQKMTLILQMYNYKKYNNRYITGFCSFFRLRSCTSIPSGSSKLWGSSFHSTSDSKNECI